MQEKIKTIEELAMKEVQETKDLNILNEIRIKYLGKKGELTSILRSMGSLTAEQRPIIGELVNKTRDKIEESIKQKEKKIKQEELVKNLKQEKLDVTMPSKKEEIGSLHPITKLIDEVKEIFVGLGYQIADGPEIEYAEYNFDKLNTPKDHPSRDLQDTMYITEDVVLRSQTSPIQARVMEKQKPPIKIICPGTVYRSDSVDATHSPVFHQIEGLAVDKNISMSDLKGTLEIFVKTYLGNDVNIRFRPHHFPFTEPSAEVDVSCFVCKGKGCRVCKGEGWIELKYCGINPKEYTGFAFGFGVERIAMAKYGIDDMRLLYENDIRFLKQF
ncbi:MAG: phenylalanine--tRNA ligase subunit alpha [Oscillospiraceae bacterium]|nr:phenylalanine--tRNA ligase subunit alpha [Oscillospiraceae bacterium]